MSNVTLIVTLKRDANGYKFPIPRVGYLPENEVRAIRVGGQGADRGSKISMDTGLSFETYETPPEVEVARDPQATNIYAPSKTLGGNAAGNAQGAGLAISTYLTEIDTATATTADSLDMPAATVGAVYVIINSTAVELQNYPATGENFDGSAANAAYNIPANSRRHFVCLTAGVWTIADDRGA